MACLSVPQPETRAEAIRTLVRLKDSRVVSALEVCAEKDPSAAVREHAAHAVKQLTGKAPIDDSASVELNEQEVAEISDLGELEKLLVEVREREASSQPHEGPQQRSRLRVWRFAVLNAGPGCIATVFNFLYVCGAGWAATASGVSDWKLAAAAVAELVKVAGNEALVWLLARTRLPASSLDGILFLYELCTGTMVRLLVLTMPNTASVVASSIVSTMVEFDCRMGLLFELQLAGRNLGAWEKEKQRAHDRLCRARVVDTHNDQIVEYLTTVLSIVLVIALQQSPHFNIGSGTIDTETLVIAGVAQVLPELVLDAVMIYFESRAGLGRHIAQYWRKQYSIGTFLTKAACALILSMVVGIALIRW